jgi:predicted CopG family antitoxin|tara:strand:+ start:260 stop:442 length:183 start_codon:yes stop_codon:yes gene_type:complete
MAQYMQRLIKDRREMILDVLQHDQVTNMEQYRELMGMKKTLDFFSQELSSLLDKQEQIDD